MKRTTAKTKMDKLLAQNIRALKKQGKSDAYINGYTRGWKYMDKQVDAIKS